MVSSGHQSVVNRLTTSTHSIQIPHPLSEDMDILEAIFIGLSGMPVLGGLWPFDELLLTSMVLD